MNINVFKYEHNANWFLEDLKKVIDYIKELKQKANKMKKEQVKLSMDEIRNRNISFMRLEMSDCMPIENGISDIDRDMNNGYIDIPGIDNLEGYKRECNIIIDIYLPEFDTDKCYLNDFEYGIMNLIDRCNLYMRALIKLNNSNNGSNDRLIIRLGNISNLPDKLQDKIKVKMDNLNSDGAIKIVNRRITFKTLKMKKLETVLGMQH